MALPSIVQADVRYSCSFFLNTDPKTLTITDLLQSGYAGYSGININNIKILVKVTSPSGQVLYINAGFGTSDFSSPDIYNGNWSLANIELALDSVTGNAETGIYTVDYKVSTDGTTMAFNAYRAITMFYEPFQTQASLSYSAISSQITSRDTTTYTLVENGVSYINQQSFILGRQQSFVGPAGSKSVVDAPSWLEEITFGGGGTPETDIWTGVWTSVITTEVIYHLATWGGDVSVIVYDTVSGGGTVTVGASACVCNVRQCILNLVERYKEALATGATVTINALREKVIKVNSAWMNFEIAERCGEPVDEFCQEIITITRGENCDCDDSGDTQHIVPVATVSGALGGGGTVSGTTISHGSGAPTGGSNDTYYFDILNFNLYAKTSGAWNMLGSFKGGTGDPGGVGATGPSITGPAGPSITGPAGPAITGPMGPARYIGYGAATPTGALGDDDDYYFMVPGYILYHKQTGTWVSLGSFLGGTGPAGPSITGPAGPAITGPPGAVGATGIGVTGGPGATGATGYVVSLSIRYDTTSPTGADVAPNALGQVWINTSTAKAWMATGLAKTNWTPLII